MLLASQIPKESSELKAGLEDIIVVYLRGRIPLVHTSIITVFVELNHYSTIKCKLLMELLCLEIQIFW